MTTGRASQKEKRERSKIERRKPANCCSVEARRPSFPTRTAEITRPGPGITLDTPLIPAERARTGYDTVNTAAG